MFNNKLKRRITKLVGTAMLVGALIGGTPNPSFSELSKRDQTKIGELRKENPNSYNKFSEKINNLSERYEKVKENLKDFKKIKKLTSEQRRDQFNILYFCLGEMYKLWGEYNAIGAQYGLKLEATHSAIKQLIETLTNLILDLASEMTSEFEKSKKLSPADVTVIKWLIGTLDEMDQKYYSGTKIRIIQGRLHRLLGKESKGKFP